MGVYPPALEDVPGVREGAHLVKREIQKRPHPDVVNCWVRRGYSY